MRKPADASIDDGFEILAVLIKELKISLFVADASNRRRALGLYIYRRGRWPAILRSDKERINFVKGERIDDVPRQNTSSFPRRLR